ncbi:MAG: ribonuclease H-like domain-containing protein [Patescibacteria group bacterium]
MRASSSSLGTFALHIRVGTLSISSPSLLNCKEVLVVYSRRMIREVVIDIETKKSFEEVGGQEHLDKLGVSVVGAYFYEDNSYCAYEEHEISLFEERLMRCDRIIGFNINHFDIPVLLPYFRGEWINEFPRLDLLQEVAKKLGHRISLDSLASATLNAKKSGNGLQALAWYKEGKIDLIKKYCLDDVRITKELYEYGKKNQKLFYTSYFKTEKLTVATEWGDTIQRAGGGVAIGFQGRLL